MLFEALICVCLVCGAAYAAPSPPTWPSSYEVEYTISLPYVSSVQPTGLKYPVHIWWDQNAAMMRLSFYDGLDDVYITPDATYNLYPRITKRTCLVIGTHVGPTTGTASGQDAGEEGGLPPPLPDISTWEYAGTAQLPGKLPTHMWQFSVRSFEKVATYTFHTAQRDGRPIHLDMLGVNLLTGSHFDQYVVDFVSFQPLISTRPFKPPMAMCKDAKDSQNKVGRMTTDQAMSLLPGVLVPSKRSNGSAGDIGAALHGQYTQEVAGGGTVSGPADPTSQTLAANLRYMQLWTGEDRAQLQQRLAAERAPLGAGPGDQGGSAGAAAVKGSVAPEDLFTLDVNKFVSWSDELWQSTMMGRAPQQRGQSPKVSASRRGRGSALLGTFKRRLSDADLPASVDWRGTGADGPVKDQASCGSCWAFATAGAMTGSWFVATNESLSLSEQQLVDCSWDYQCPDSFCGGCWGGNPEGALQYVYDHGGVALEASYSYKGQNGVCRENQTAKSAAFKGFLSVPTKDEGALMEAVATHGPVAISFDAVHPTFKYYSEGVYYREDCGQDEDHLNHAVTLVGYGTTPGGTDYWLLRNSWSQFWGEGGYFKMARKGNDCGVTVDGVIAVVDEDAAERARKRHDKKGKRTTLHTAEY